MTTLPSSMQSPLLLYAALGAGLAFAKATYLVFALVVTALLLIVGTSSDGERFVRFVAAGIGYFAARQIFGTAAAPTKT